MTDHDNFGGDVMARVRDPNYRFTPVPPVADEPAIDDERATQPRTWLVQELVPEKGVGLLSGQSGAGKTFLALDLAASVMSGTPFAGREVARQGGVMFVAAEGQAEVSIRLEAIARHRLGLTEGERLPFVWVEEGNLKAGLPALTDRVRRAENGMKDRFGLPLALIIVDTVTAAGDFKDANDAAEGQRIMNALSALGKAGECITIGIDHFGKAVETGTRGSSAKEAAADVVLAALAEQDTSGNWSERRLAVRKLRGGSSGAVTPYSLNAVRVEEETTCIIEWAEAGEAGAPSVMKDKWPKSARVLKAALLEVLITEGQMRRPFGGEGPEVKTVPLPAVRKEFYASYPADGDDERAIAATKRAAFNRGIASARHDGLIGSREIGGEDHLWIIDGMAECERTETPPRDMSRSFAQSEPKGTHTDANERDAPLESCHVRSHDMPAQINREDTIAAVLAEDSSEIPESEEHKKRVASVRTKAWRRKLKFAWQPGIPGVPSFLILPQDDGKALFASDDLEAVEAWLRDHAKPQRRGGEVHNVEQ